MSQTAEQLKLCVSTVAGFVSRVDVSPFGVTRRVSTFMSPTMIGFSFAPMLPWFALFAADVGVEKVVEFFRGGIFGFAEFVIQLAVVTVAFPVCHGWDF